MSYPALRGHPLCRMVCQRCGVEGMRLASASVCSVEGCKGRLAPADLPPQDEDDEQEPIEDWKARGDE